MKKIIFLLAMFFTISAYSQNGTVSSPQLPKQTGNAGKYLKTDGTKASWASVTAGLSASLTTGYIPYAVSSSSLANSILNQTNDYTLDLKANNNSSNFRMYNAGVLKTTFNYSNPADVFSLTSVGGVNFNSGYGGNINLLTSYSDIIAHGFRGKVILKTTDGGNVEHNIIMENNGNLSVGGKVAINGGGSDGNLVIKSTNYLPGCYVSTDINDNETAYGVLNTTSSTWQGRWFKDGSLALGSTAYNSAVKLQVAGNISVKASLDGEGSGNDNATYTTSVGGFRSTYYGQSGSNTVHDYQTNGVLGTRIYEGTGYYSLSTKNRYSIKNLNTNTTKFLIDMSTGYTGIGNDYFVPDAQLEVKQGLNDYTSNIFKLQNGYANRSLNFDNDGLLSVTGRYYGYWANNASFDIFSLNSSYGNIMTVTSGATPNIKMTVPTSSAGLSSNSIFKVDNGDGTSTLKIVN